MTGVQTCALPISGAVRRLTPDETPEEFWATTGGMGLTGVITEAEIDLIPVETAMIRADTERASDLEDLMARMDARDDEYRYSVAWIDCLATGRSTGRGILDRGDHATLDELKPAQRAKGRTFAPHAFVSAPPIFSKAAATCRFSRSTWVVWRMSRRRFSEDSSPPSFGMAAVA